MDYQTINLAPVCNSGLAFIRPNVRLTPGLQHYRGLPFRIGGEPPDAERCLIGFAADDTNPRVVPIGAPAKNVLFAHALLESRILEGEPVGAIVAHYVVRYADGAEIRLPMRERFEIAVVPIWWGGLPLLAVPDSNEGLMPRYTGRWDQMGERQAEAEQAWPEYFYLWNWTNPHPERAIESITLVPAGRKMVVAAITLGHIDEQPLRRTAKREVLVTLPNAEDAARPFDLAVTVDRGIATYPHALPAQPPDAFLDDPQRGWGQAQNTANSPAYTEIAAIPSATITIKSGDEPLVTLNWGELQRAGTIQTPRARLQLVDRGRNWVRVNILDDDTGRPVHCRVHFRSPEGIPYQPHGHHHQVNANLGTWHNDIGGDLRLEQISYAYIDGMCEGWLPRGEALVDVARGFEYEPLRARVTITPGQQELTLRLKRWTNMNERRWFSGDTHVHFLGANGAHREAQAEDLNIVNLLQSQWGHLFTNTEDALGQSVSNGGRTIVYTSQENRQHMLGHLTLLGLTTPVMPWCTDGPSEAELGGALETTMAAWADACHAQGGTVIIPHLPNPNVEPAALIATNRADAVEIIDAARYNHLEYYRYLNCGYRLPLVGGTDKMSSDVPVGLYRTYAYIPDEEFSYAAWCRALRAGRTFVSGGPILHFSVEGRQLGDTITLPRGGGAVEVEAVAESTTPIHTLEIIQQGRVVAATEATNGARRLQVRAKLSIDSHTWLAARCGGPGYYSFTRHHDTWSRGMFAHTSPIYVAVGEEWRLFDRTAADYMLTLVGGGLEYIRNAAPYYPPGSVTHHHGEADHQAFLERPFHEAIAAIHRRMHELGIAH